MPAASGRELIGLRMLAHPDESSHHEDGDDEGDEREIAEADAQEYSEALHGGGFHEHVGDRVGCLSLYLSKQGALAKSDERPGTAGCRVGGTDAGIDAKRLSDWLPIKAAFRNQNPHPKCWTVLLFR